MGIKIGGKPLDEYIKAQKQKGEVLEDVHGTQNIGGCIINSFNGGTICGTGDNFMLTNNASVTINRNGKKYRLTHADGVKLDEDNFPQMKVAEAGEGVLGAMRYSDFTLTFEPFETPPAAFDFIEGDVEGAFAIRNISTKQ